MLKLITLIIVIITIQTVIPSQSVQGQQSQLPVQKEGLLKSLRKQQLTIESLTDELSLFGVDFQLSPTLEREIRRAGRYLGKTDLDKLISVVRYNYRSNERLRLSLFKYAPCERYFEQFADLLSSKVKALPSQLIEKDRRSSYTAGLIVVKEDQPLEMSLLEVNQYWDKTRSLQLLQGTCTSKENEVYVISQVFLGTLRGRLADPIRIKFKVDTEEYGATRDIHSLLILYSLAKDAQSRRVSKDLVIAYLSEALGIASQIKHLDRETLSSIKAAIETTLREAGASDLVALPVK